MTLPTGSLYQIFDLVATGGSCGISGLCVVWQSERGRPGGPAPLFENRELIEKLAVTHQDGGNLRSGGVA